MGKPDYKSLTYLLAGILIGCSGDVLIERLIARLLA